MYICTVRPLYLLVRESHLEANENSVGVKFRLRVTSFRLYSLVFQIVIYVAFDSSIN